MNTVETIRKLRETVLANCKERIDIAAQTCKNKKIELQRGTSSILKNKWV